MHLTEKTLKEAFPNAVEIRRKRTTGHKYAEVRLTVEFGDTNGYALMTRTTWNPDWMRDKPLTERQEKWHLKVAKYSEPRTVAIDGKIIFTDLNDDQVIAKIREGMQKLGIT